MTILRQMESQGEEIEGVELLTLHWDDSTPLQPTSWCVQNVLEAGTVNLMVGASGSGKSFLAIDLSISVANGEKFFGFPAEKGGVFYVAAEGGYTIARRLRAAKGQHASGRPFTYIRGLSDLLTEDGLNRFLATAKKANELMIRDHGVPVSLVIIDTLIAAFYSKNWNDMADAMKVMNILQRIQSELKVTVVGIHHHGKNTDNGPTGSVALTAAPDNVLSVFFEKDNNGKVSSRHIAFTKIRDGDTGFTCSFELASVQIGVHGEDEPVFSAYVKPLLDSSTIGKISSKKARVSKSSKAQDVFVDAFRIAVDLQGGDHPNPNGVGSVKAVTIEAFKDEFQNLYKAKPGSSDPIEAARGACKRVLSQLKRSGPIQRGRWGQQDWLYEIPEGQI
jgi:hypothetical protein